MDVTVSCERGDDSSELFRLILENEDSISGSAGDAHSRPTETFSLSPEKIEYTATTTPSG